MSGLAIAGLVVAVGSTAYGISQSQKAAKAQKAAANDAAAVDVQTAKYNAQVDTAQAQQIDLDTNANIATERQSNAVYLSRQVASYAASGVLATTGSALHTQVTTAGRMQQQLEQQYSDSQRKQELLYAQAQEGVYYGQANASADKASGDAAAAAGTAAMITGGAKIAGMAFQAYNSGVFSNGGSGSADTSFNNPEGFET